MNKKDGLGKKKVNEKILKVLKKITSEEKTINFGILNRKLLTLKIIFEDLKKAVHDKVETSAVHELYNLKREFDTLVKELKLT